MECSPGERETRHREERFSSARGWCCRGTVVEGARTLMVEPRVQVVTCATCGTKNRVPDRASGVPKCGKCGASLPWITESGDDEFDEIVEDAAIPVLVDMWAEWCGPCRMVSPALEQVARDLSGRLKLVKVNVDTSPVLAVVSECSRSPPSCLSTVAPSSSAVPERLRSESSGGGWTVHSPVALAERIWFLLRRGVNALRDPENASGAGVSSRRRALPRSRVRP